MRKSGENQVAYIFYIRGLVAYELVAYEKKKSVLGSKIFGHVAPPPEAWSTIDMEMTLFLFDVLCVPLEGNIDLTSK